MPLDIGKFKDKLVDNKGPAGTDRFEVTFYDTPTSAVDYHRDNYINFFCTSAELPMRSISTISNKPYGPERKIATGTTYVDTTMSFLCTNSGLKEKRFFDSWQDSINNTTGYDVKYHKDYAKNIKLSMYNEFNETIYSCTFIEAFPIMVGGITLNQSSKELATISVTFSFYRWTRDSDISKTID